MRAYCGPACHLMSTVSFCPKKTLCERRRHASSKICLARLEECTAISQTHTMVVENGYSLLPCSASTAQRWEILMALDSALNTWKDRPMPTATCQSKAL